MLYQQKKALYLLVLTGLLLFWGNSVTAQTTSDDEAVYQRFDQISRLRGLNDIEGALEILEEIIQEYSDAEEVIRRAYNQMVYTLTFAQRPEEARARAAEALRRFPDLHVDPAYVPQSLDRLYDELRSQMFGTLIINEPEECRVFLDDEHVGNTPLEIPLILARAYQLELLKSGYHAYEDTLRIAPSGIHEMSFSLDRDRSKGWWLKRIGIGAVTGTIAAIIMINNSGSDDPQSLPGPPAVPDL